MRAYSAKVSRQIDRWVEQGLIDGATAETLRQDLRVQGFGAISFGRVLAIMAAILIAAAILIVVAANFEAIPRVVRVLGLFMIIAASYVGGALCKTRRRDGAGEALYLIGTAAFGGSIALVSQMYHLSGDEADAVLVWFAGTIAAAIMLRSPILTNAAVPLALGWLFTRFDWGLLDRGPSHLFLLLLAAIWLVSYWTDSRVARNLVVSSAILYAAIYAIGDDTVTIAILLSVASAAVFVVAWLYPQQVERFAQLGGPQPVLPLVGFLTGIALLQAQFAETSWPMLVLAFTAFAGIVAALLMRGRESRMMRSTAYLAFSVELVLVYIITIGSMIDTGALFLFSGVALALVAWLISRIERKIGRTQEAGGKP